MNIFIAKIITIVISINDTKLMYLQEAGNDEVCLRCKKFIGDLHNYIADSNTQVGIYVFMC